MQLKILIFSLFITSFSFGQTYTYSKKTVNAIVETTKGNEYRVLNSIQGPHRFVFEMPINEKKLFTLHKPNEDLAPGQAWYGFLKDIGYIEKDGILFKKSIYYFTGTNEQVMVFIANDFSKIIIFNKDDTIWEFMN